MEVLLCVSCHGACLRCDVSWLAMALPVFVFWEVLSGYIVLVVVVCRWVCWGVWTCYAW